MDAFFVNRIYILGNRLQTAYYINNFPFSILNSRSSALRLDFLNHIVLFFDIFF